MPIDAGLLLRSDPIGAQQRGFNYSRQIMDLAANQQAGSQFASGNYSGATSALANNGDLPGAQSMQQYGQKAGGAGLSYVASALPKFQAVLDHAQQTDPNNVAAYMGDAFDHIAAEAKIATGVSDQQLAAFRQMLTSDPQGAIARMKAQIPVEWHNAGDDLVGTSQGRITGTYTGTKTTTAGPGQTVLQSPAMVNGQPVGGDTPAPQAPPAQAPQPAQVQAQPSQPSAPAPLGIRSNNPGNLQPGGQEATFSNPTAGVLAASENLDAYAKQGVNTVSDIINKWAPAADQNGNVLPNNTGSYIQFVAQKLGVSPNQPLNLADKNVKGALLEAMFQMENGQQPQVGGGAQTAAAQPQAQAPAQSQPSNGAKVLYQGGPQWRAPNADELKQYPGATQINAATGQVKYPPLAALGAQLTPDQLQPLVDIVKAGGTLPQRAMSNPATYSKILQMAQEQGVSPASFLANQGNRKATQSAFTQVNTRYAMVQTQEQAFQNSLNLAYTLAQNAGPQGGGTLINGWRNYLKTGITGDPATGAFINAVSTAMNEYGKIIEGSTGNAGSSISARDDANKMLSAADNLPAFVEKMKVLQADAGYKIGALKDQHDTLLTTLGTIGDQGSPGPTPSPAPPSNGSQGPLNLKPGSNYQGLPVLTPAAALKLKPGSPFYSTDGRKLYR